MTTAIILSVLFILWIAMPKSLEADLVTNLRRSHCFIRRQHMNTVVIGDLHKKGYRPIPMRQCQYCAEIIVSAQEAQRFGAKVA